MSLRIAPREPSRPSSTGSPPLSGRLSALAGAALLIAYPIVASVAIERGAPWLAYIPPVALNAMLAAVFAATLRAGREPMIARFARAERGVLEPDLARYARRVTIVWVTFFVLMAVLSAGIASSGNRGAWLAFTGVGNYLLVALLFVGEWAFRRLRFPQYRHASPLALARLVRTALRR